MYCSRLMSINKDLLTYLLTYYLHPGLVSLLLPLARKGSRPYSYRPGAHTRHHMRRQQVFAEMPLSLSVVYFSRHRPKPVLWTVECSGDAEHGGRGGACQ